MAERLRKTEVVKMTREIGNWFWKTREKVYGPYNEDQLSEFLLPVHLVAGAPGGPWKRAGEIADLGEIVKEECTGRSSRTWFVMADGEEMGPFSKVSLKELLFHGRVTLSSMVKYQGWTEWRPIGATPLVRKTPGAGRLFRVESRFSFSGTEGFFDTLILASSAKGAEEAVLQIAEDEIVADDSLDIAVRRAEASPAA